MRLLGTVFNSARPARMRFSADESFRPQRQLSNRIRAASASSQRDVGLALRSWKRPALAFRRPRKCYPGERHTPTPATNVVDISREPCKEPAAETGAKSAAGHGDHNERGQVSTLAITRAAYSAAGPGLARGRQRVGFLGQACGFGGEVGNGLQDSSGRIAPCRYSSPHVAFLCPRSTLVPGQDVR